MRGCNASDTVDIRTRVDPPVGFLPSDTAICSYGTLRLTPRNGYSEYLWNNGEAGYFLVADQPGLYWLQVHDAWGCQGRDSVVVSLKDCGKGLFVPTAFTPNHDGINDGFRPLLHGSWSSFRCTVYDRFGKLVFRTDDPREAWDGNIRGVPAPSGTFTWVCSFTLTGESIQTRKGTVVLIR